MGRIENAFSELTREGKKGFIPFITAGDPDLQATGELLVELAQAGATIIELGVPFTDPMADGPVIQRASERALKHGFGVQEVLDVAASARGRIATPIILFTYFNPLLQFGLQRLAIAAKRAGIDGVLVTDLIPEEAGDFASEMRANELDLIFLVAPTSTDTRLKLIDLSQATLMPGLIDAHTHMFNTPKPGMSREMSALIATQNTQADSSMQFHELE